MDLNEIESFIGNYMKNKAEFDNYIKKNLSYSKVISNKKGMYKAKTSININKIGPIKKNSYTTLYKTKTSKSSNTSIFENRAADRILRPPAVKQSSRAVFHMKRNIWRLTLFFRSSS